MGFGLWMTEGQWMKRKSCEGCYHYRWVGGPKTEMACHYMFDMGIPRGCPAEKCDKKRLGKKPKVRITVVEKRGNKRDKRGKN